MGGLVLPVSGSVYLDANIFIMPFMQQLPSYIAAHSS